MSSFLDYEKKEDDLVSLVGPGPADSRDLAEVSATTELILAIAPEHQLPGCSIRTKG